MAVSMVEFSGDNLDLVEGLCLHPNDPPKMLEVMTPYMEVRKKWLQDMAERGLWLAVALGADGEKHGLVECIPIEWAAEPVRGEDSLFINCLWVLPPYWKSGVARELMNYLISRAKGDGSRPGVRSKPGIGGVTVLGYEGDRWFGYFPYMSVKFFKRFGFEEVDRDGSRVLLHIDFGRASKPSLLRPKARTDVHGNSADHLVEVLYNSQCPWSGWMIDGVKHNLGRFDVEVRLVNTDDRATVEEYGMTRGVCVDGRPLIARLASGREVVSAIRRYLEEVKMRNH